MGVYANGQLLYGFVHTDETDELFQAIRAAHKNGEEIGFEELHPALQTKHSISLFSICDSWINCLAAFSAVASNKLFEDKRLATERLQQTADYDQHIQAFLTALDIDPTPYTPKWHLLGYMD